MATLRTIHQGSLRTEITHTQSGSRVITDAPLDNHGKGESISPTDMVAGALGSCMLTIMDMAAQRMGIDLTGTTVDTDKIMSSDPRRIGEIHMDFRFPFAADAKTRKILERAADTCPVAKSLHPDIKLVINYHYAEE